MSERLETSVMNLELKPGDPIVLPEVFKAALGLEKGGDCTIVRLDGVVLLISRPLVSLKALEGMRQALQADGVVLEDLLAGLADVRTQMLEERYGLTPST